jgi:hypothetical protein
VQLGFGPAYHQLSSIVRKTQRKQQLFPCHLRMFLIHFIKQSGLAFRRKSKDAICGLSEEQIGLPCGAPKRSLDGLSLTIPLKLDFILHINPRQRAPFSVRDRKSTSIRPSLASTRRLTHFLVGILHRSARYASHIATTAAGLQSIGRIEMPPSARGTSTARKSQNSTTSINDDRLHLRRRTYEDVCVVVTQR